MSTNTKIEWTDATWNPIIGCSKCSPGCNHCYAERMAVRQCHMSDASPYHQVVQMADICTRDNWNGKTALVESALEKPLHWKKPRKIFVCSMGDLFHESVPYEWIDRVFAVAALCPQQTFQILTKRAENMADYIVHLSTAQGARRFERQSSDPMRLHKFALMFRRGEVLPNVWLGVTVCNQDEADAKIPHLIATPAAVRFVSIEPMLGPVDLATVHFQQTGVRENALRCDVSQQAQAAGIEKLNGIDWVIVGGETGPGARPIHPAWVRDVRHQCRPAGVPFFFKKWGEWIPRWAKTHISHDSSGHDDPDSMRWDCVKMCSVCGGDRRSDVYIEPCDHSHEFSRVAEEYMQRVGKKRAGHLLDGREWREFPKGAMA